MNLLETLHIQAAARLQVCPGLKVEADARQEFLPTKGTRSLSPESQLGAAPRRKLTPLLCFDMGKGKQKS